MKTMVISGINLFEGGPLSVFHDCLINIIKNNIQKEYKIIALVYRKELYSEFLDEDNIEFIEFPKSRKNYIYRLYYEYIGFYLYSRKQKIDTWISLHDITPNVVSEKRYVYCHNPTPFLKTDIKDAKYSLSNYLFSIFYKYLYGINIQKNTNVIVQQNWIRNEFKKIYKIDNIIVAIPSIEKAKGIEDVRYKNNVKDNSLLKFIYPSFPRFFKNFEVICQASELLVNRGVTQFQVALTIDGSENRYSRDIYKKYNKIPNIKFIGLQPRERLFELYNEVDCLIFPSKLETWGLPISEFKFTQKPIILSKLPYAFETIGTYNKACFFNPEDAVELAQIMEDEIGGRSACREVYAETIEEPYCSDWKSLFERILNK